MDLHIDTSDLKVLEEYFTDLTIMDQRRVWIDAMKKSAGPMVDTARNLAPMGKSSKNRIPGALRRSIGVIYKPNDIAALFGIRTGGMYVGWRGKWIEEGWTATGRKSKGSVKMRNIDKNARQVAYFSGERTGPRRMAGEWFIRNAYLWNEDNYQANFQHEMQQAVYRKMLRAQSKMKRR
jgi:hypothetical protein